MNSELEIRFPSYVLKESVDILLILTLDVVFKIYLISYKHLKTHSMPFELSKVGAQAEIKFVFRVEKMGNGRFRFLK